MNLKLASVSRSRRRISLTPLIDVVFILLVFFMLESSFLKVRSIDLALPDASSESVEQFIKLDLLADGHVRLDGATLTTLEWMPVLQSRGAPAATPILLTSEPSVPMQQVVDTLDLLRRYGFEQLALSAAEEMQR